MQLVIDRNGCIGCGVCAETCPGVFRMAEDGLAEVWGELSGHNADAAEAAEEAVENCPVSVITIE